MKITNVDRAKPSAITFAGMELDKMDYELISPERIIDIICKYYKVQTHHIMGRDRKREYSFPRQLVQWCLFYIKRFRLQQIGGIVDKVHATVIHSRQTVDNLIKTNKIVRNQVSEILKQLGVHHTVTVGNIIID